MTTEQPSESLVYDDDDSPYAASSELAQGLRDGLSMVDGGSLEELFATLDEEGVGYIRGPEICEKLRDALGIELPASAAEDLLSMVDTDRRGISLTPRLSTTVERAE